MNGRRFYLIMLGLVGLLALGILASAYLGSSLLNKQSNKLMALKLDSRVAEEQQNALTQAKIYVEKYSDLAKNAKAVVPQDKDQAQAVRELVKIAGANGVTLGSIQFPSSTLGQSPAAVSPTPSEESTPAATPKSSLSQVQPVAGIPGVYEMSIAVNSDTDNKVTYAQFINFLEDLEKNRRTAQVKSIVITPDLSNRNVLTFSLVLSVYIKP